MKIPFQPQNVAYAGQGSPLLDRLVDQLTSVFKKLGSIVTNNKVVPAKFTTPATDVVVFHGLGFVYTSWDVVDIDANAVVYRSPTANNQPDRSIILRASAVCNARIRFE